MRLHARLALCIPGAARVEGDRFFVPSAMGPLAEGLSAVVDSLDVVAYDPPPVARELRDNADYGFATTSGLRLVSLGEKGSLRNLAQRRAATARLIAEHSQQWDVTLYRLANRRAGLIARANRCPRSVGYIGGLTPAILRQTDISKWRLPVALTSAWLAERDIHKIGRRAGLFFGNGDEIVTHYRGKGINATLLRTSSTFAHDYYEKVDRMTNDGLTIAVVGRVTAAKGVFDALEAFSLLRTRISQPMRLVFIGGGDAENELARASAAGIGDDVAILGWQSAGNAVLAELRKADVMIHLSRAESMPRAVSEAMTQSVPVVATPVGSLTHVFAHERELLFVPVGDPQAAAAAVERLFRDGALRRGLIARGRGATRANSVEAVSEELIRRIHDRWPELVAT